MEKREQHIEKPSVSLVIMGVAITIMLTSIQAQTAHRHSGEALHGEEAIRSLKEQDLYESLQAAVAAARYEIARDNALGRAESSAFRAPNPAQQYDAWFRPDGISLARRYNTVNPATPLAAAQSEGEPEWRATMRLAGYGYGSTLLMAGAAELSAAGNRVEYRRAWPPVTEWYINQATGLEQGFTIASAPGARLGGERLQIVLELIGDLRAELAEGGAAVALKQANGNLALNYSDLRAYDAHRRPLPAQMRVSNGQIILEIDDEDAAYPVTIDPTFRQNVNLTAGNGSENDHFGQSVSISGNTAVIGASSDDVFGNSNQGSVYVFVRSTSSVCVNGCWSQQAHLTASDGRPGDGFGRSVGISGDTIIVGAPYADYVFVLEMGAGFTILADDYGAAYVFVRSGSMWTQQARFEPWLNDDMAPKNFGWSVSISPGFIVVGSPNDDTYINGNKVVHGLAHVYARSGANWWYEGALMTNDRAEGDKFGWSVGVRGNRIVAGAPGDDNGSARVDSGSACVFHRYGSWIQESKLTPTDAIAGDQFGSSVAINGPADKIVVGAPGADVGGKADQGAAYLFSRSNSFWGWQEKLAAPDGAAGDRFGLSVAMSTSTVVAGAPYHNIGATADQGAAYVFVCSPCGAPQKLAGSYGAALDGFGASVGIQSETVPESIIVGAPWDDVPRVFCSGANCSGVDQGSAYIFFQ